MAYGIVNVGQAASTSGKQTARFIVGTSTAGWTEKDCDYLCDGADDQIEINAAIQALPAGGGKIVILDGTYHITSSIIIDKNYISLTGSGRSAILKREWEDTTSDTGVIHVKSDFNVKGLTIQNITIDGNKNYYSSWRNNGLYMYIAVNSVISNNLFKNCSRDGVHMDSRSNNNTICGNIFESNYNGIYITVCDDNTLIGNVCNNNDNCGIYLYAADNQTLTGNVCNNNGLDGIRDTRNNSSYIKGSNAISGNDCCDNNKCGIHLYYGGNTNVSGNVCNNNGTYGIHLESCKNSNIVGNTCIRGNGLASDYSSSQHTIYLNGTASNNQIVYNHIFGKNYVNAGSTGNTFTGNKYQ